MITTTPFIDCTNCGKKTSEYYLESGFKGEICEECLLKHDDGEFPCGKGVHQPCKLCVEPVIRWFYVATYGRIEQDCGYHDGDNVDEYFGDFF